MSALLVILGVVQFNHTHCRRIKIFMYTLVMSRSCFVLSKMSTIVEKLCARLNVLQVVCMKSKPSSYLVFLATNSMWYTDNLCVFWNTTESPEITCRTNQTQVCKNFVYNTVTNKWNIIMLILHVHYTVLTIKLLLLKMHELWFKFCENTGRALYWAAQSRVVSYTKIYLQHTVHRYMHSNRNVMQ